jgi:acetyl esterase/lipase
MRYRAASMSIVAVILGSVASCGDEPDHERLARTSVESTTVVESTSVEESTTVEESTLPYFTSYDGPGTEPTMLRFVPSGAGGWPVVVLLHGQGMDGDAMEPVATALAERGLLVYAPTYRLVLAGVRAEQLESGQWAGETLIGDLACAVRTARADAADQGADTDRLVLVGYSMGAAFGATTAIVGDDPELTSRTSGPCVGSEGSAVPDAFFGWEGPYDWDEVAEVEYPQVVDLAPEAIRSLGPLPHVEAGLPDEPVPFHLRAGDQPYRSFSLAEHLATFDAALDAAGWPVTADVLPGKIHTDFIDPGIPELEGLIGRIADDPAS